MLQNSEYDYLVNFFDAGTLNKLRSEMKAAERAVDNLTKKAEGLRTITSQLGFGNDPKGELAANRFIGTGGAQAARQRAIEQGRRNRREATLANQFLKELENRNREAKRFHKALEVNQAEQLAAQGRVNVQDKKISSLKEAQINLLAAQIRTGKLARASAQYPNIEGLRGQLGVAQSDEAAAQQLVTQLQKQAKLSEKVTANKAKQAKLDRDIAITTERRIKNQQTGNTGQLRALAIQRAKLRLEELELSKEKLTTAEYNKQYAALKRISGARTKGIGIDGEVDSFERRFKDGGAALFKIQGQLLANYAAMGLALRSLSFAGRFVVDLDKEFAQLQAITATTDEAMGELEKTLIGVSEKTKFTALEVAQASTILGQAGFSVDQIKTSIESITLLATAVGADLKTTVDLVTSTISVFNLRAEEAGHVADIFTAAVNNSKLNLEKLTLGLQYAGNIAHEQNITFSELTATLGAMANSGIRAGSTLGTGLRQILTALAAPSEKLQGKLQELGLTTTDVDVKLHGFVGVLNNLKDAGFTTSDAIQVLEVRAGAAYAALSNNSDTIEELRQQFLLTAAATEANSIQMEALANKGARLQSIFGTVAAKALEPLVQASKGAIDVLGVLLSVLNKIPLLLPILTTTLVAYTAAIVANRAAILARNLTGKNYIKVLLGERVAATAAAGANKILAASVTKMGFVLGGILIAFTAISAGVDYFTESIDELKSKMDESTGRLDTYTQNLKSINGEIDKLSKRHFDATTPMGEVNNLALELQHKFGDLGAEFDFTSGSVAGLVPELERLRDVMLEVRNAELGQNIVEAKKLLDEQVKRAGRSDMFRSRGLNGILPRDTYDIKSAYSPFHTNDPLISNFRDLAGGRRDTAFLSETYQLFSNRRSRNTKIIRDFETGSPSQQTKELVRGLIPELKRSGFGFRFQQGDSLEQNMATAIKILKTQQYALNKFNPEFLSILQTRSQIDSQERAITQTQFDLRPDVKARRETFRELQQDFTRIKAEKGVDSPEAKEEIRGVVAQIRQEIEKDKAAFTGDDERLYQQSGLAQQGAALLAQGESALRMSKVQLRERQSLNDLLNEAGREEMNAIRKRVTIRSTEAEIEEGRQESLRILQENFERDKEAELKTLRDSNASDKVLKATEAALDRKYIAQKTRINEEFDKISFNREVKMRDEYYSNLQSRLTSEIETQQALVSNRSTVAEIEEAKAQSLRKFAQYEEAVRNEMLLGWRKSNTSEAQREQDLREHNLKMEAERKRLVKTFDDMHKPIKDRVAPELKNALKGLTQAFKEAAQALDEERDEIQHGLKDVEAQRASMDTPENAHQFSDVHRREMDKQVSAARLEAMQKEKEVFQKQLQLYEKTEVDFQIKKDEIDRQLAEQQAIVDGYDPNDANSQVSQDAATTAQAKINRLKGVQQTAQERILEQQTAIAAKTGEIRDLEREIAIQTGESAPQRYGWFQGLKNGLENYMERLQEATITAETFADTVGEVMETAKDSLADAFFDMATGAKSVGEAFGDMAKSILKAILKILAQQAAIFAVKTLLSFFKVPMAPTPAGGGGIFGFQQGGVIPVRRARGGTIPSVGVKGRDYTPVLAEAGEFMLRKTAVDSIGKENLHKLNSMGAAALQDRPSNVIIPQGGNKEVNVYVVAPDQKPTLGEDDIIHVISQDIVKNGRTKKLIKHVMMN